MPRFTHTTPGKPPRQGINPFTKQPLLIPGRPGIVRFWEAELRGRELHLARGAVGELGASWTKSCADDAAAASHFSRCVAAREREGFVSAGDAGYFRQLAPASAPMPAAEQMAALLMRESVELHEGSVATGVPYIEIIAALFRDTRSSMIRSLEVGMEREGPFGLSHLVDAIASAAPASLEQLFLGSCSIEVDRLSWMPLGDCEPVFDLPSIRELVFQGVDFQLGYASAPTLQKLEVRTGSLTKQSLGALFAADLPSLTSFSLWLGPSENAGPETEQIAITDLQPLFDGGVFSGLKHLGIQNTSFTSQVFLALASSSLLSGLESLDLSLGTLGGGWSRLRDAAPAFAHLQRLDISQNRIPDTDLPAWQRVAKQVVCHSQHRGGPICA